MTRSADRPSRRRRRALRTATASIAVALALVAGCAGDADTPAVLSTGTVAPSSTASAAEARPLEVSPDVAVALGEAAGANGLVRWPAGRVAVTVEGTPTTRDLEILEDATSRIGGLTELTFTLDAGRDPDLRVVFAPRDDWPTDVRDQTDVAHVLGVTGTTWGADGTLGSATVAIDSTIGQAARNHTIVHEMFHAVGLGHAACPTSIVHGGPAGTPGWGLSPLDEQLVATWYRPELPTGADADQVTAALTVVPTGPACRPQSVEAAESPEGTIWCELVPTGAQPCRLVDGLGPEPVVPFGPTADRWALDDVVYDHDPIRYEAFTYEGRRLLCERTTDGRWPCQFTDGPGPLTAVDRWTDGQVVYESP